MDPEIVVSIPAKPDYLHVLRSVIASVASRLDIPIDTTEDLRLAADEACAQLLSLPVGATSLTLSIRPSEGSLEMLARIDADGAAWPPPHAEDSWSWQILNTLADEVRYERVGHDPALRLAKRFTTPSVKR